MVRLFLLSLATLLFVACKTSDSDVKEVTKYKSSFHNKKSYIIHADLDQLDRKEADIQVIEYKNQVLTLRVRDRDRKVTQRDTSGYDNGLTFKNFLRNITNNFGRGLTSETVVLEEKWSTWKIYTPRKAPVVKGDNLILFEICERFDPDVKKPIPAFTLIQLGDVARKKIYRAQKDDYKYCR